MGKIVSAFFATLLLLSGFVARAQQQQKPPSAPPGALVTDRPDFTESTETIPQGRKQIEGGYTFARTGEERSDSIGELLLRVATGARSELRVGFPNYARLRGSGAATGFEDASLGAKFRLRDAGEDFGLRRPAVSLIVATSLPTGGRAYRVRALQPEAKLCLSAELSNRLGVAANLNYAYLSDDGDRFGEFSSSLSLAQSLSERTGVFLEYFGFFPGGSGRADSHYVNAGATYLINNDVQWDGRVGKGLNGAADDYFVGLGAARRF